MLFINRQRVNEDWLPISDLMSGLMVIFILITVSYIYTINKEREILQIAKIDILKKEAELAKQKEEINKIKEKVLNVSKNFNDIGAALNQYLRREFSKDLEKWNAEILSDNTIRFKSPEVIFNSGESDLKFEFITILNDFIPRYIRVLSNFSNKDYISEIRIEGHTSSKWANFLEKEAYIKNAELSQKRAFAVLEYILKNKVDKNFNWLRKILRANGLSSSNLILKNGIEDEKASRRVEFRVIVNTKSTIDQMEEAINELNHVIR